MKGARNGLRNKTRVLGRNAAPVATGTTLVAYGGTGTVSWVGAAVTPPQATFGFRKSSGSPCDLPSVSLLICGFVFKLPP